MPLSAAQLADIKLRIASIAAEVSALQPDDFNQLQAELDGVNAELDAVRAQVAIVLQVCGDPQYTDIQKLDLIKATLGTQS